MDFTQSNLSGEVQLVRCAIPNETCRHPGPQIALAQTWPDRRSPDTRPDCMVCCCLQRLYHTREHGTTVVQHSSRGNCPCTRVQSHHALRRCAAPCMHSASWTYPSTHTRNATARSKGYTRHYAPAGRNCPVTRVRSKSLCLGPARASEVS